MKKLILILLCLTVAFSCRREEADSWQPTDLLSYGVPLVIQAPDSVEIKTRDWGGGLIKDLTLQGDDNYDIQIYMSDAQTSDISKIKAEQLAEVKGNRFFSRIVKEEEPGFLYETRQDSSHTYYGFRFIFLQGDKEYIFQQGMAALLSLEETERLYQAVQPQTRRRQ